MTVLKHCEFVRYLVVAGVLLAGAGCTPELGQETAPPEAAGPTASERPADSEPSQTVPLLHQEALELIDRLDENGHGLSTTGDEVTEPKSFGSLVQIGREALPTILRVAETTDDSWTRDLLIDIAGRIGDPGARPSLVRFLQVKSSNTVSEAIGALGRLGSAEAIPALRELLGRDSTAGDDFRRLQILEAIYRCGDESVLADVLAIGLAREEQRFAARILAQHQPLRDALGFERPYRRGNCEMIDEDMFFPAAEEWYREEVLGEPSPRRVAQEGGFSQPFLEAKRAAWAVLLKSCEDGNGRFSNFRATAVDPVLTAADASRALTVISGWGHGHGLVVLAWRTEPSGQVRGHRFELRDGPPRSAFPEDLGELSYSTLTLTPSDYAALVAGLRTLLEAKLSPWWSGPGIGCSRSTGNFVASLRGLEETNASSTSFCGYPGSDNRTQHLAPRAALGWIRKFLAERPPFAQAQAGDRAKRAFSETLRDEQAQWAPGGGPWWVRERMVSLARAFGDDTLRAPLAHYLAPEYARAEHSRSRTAAKACTALAAITGNDLRFAPDGSPREVRDVAKAYQALLEAR